MQQVAGRWDSNLLFQAFFCKLFPDFMQMHCPACGPVKRCQNQRLGFDLISAVIRVEEMGHIVAPKH
jgi:hypothetical protein